MTEPRVLSLERLTEPQEEFSLRDALNVLFRHALAMILIMALSLATVAGYLAVTRTQYEAVARVLVGLGREKFGDLGMETRPLGNLVFQERAQNINNEVEILRDTDLMRRAFPAIKARMARDPHLTEHAPLGKLKARVTGWLVDAGLAKAGNPDISLAIGLYRSLDVTAVKETDVIDVEFTWNDPVFAADALNIYLDEYNKQHLRVYETTRAVGFFTDQLKKAQAGLQDVEAQQIAFMHEGGISNFEAEKTQKLAELGALREQAAGLRRDSDVAGARDAADAAEPAADTQLLDQNIIQLQGQRSRLLARFEPEADQVQDVDRQIADLRRQKAQRMGSVHHARAAAIGTRADRLDAAITQLVTELRVLTDKTSAYDAIQRRRTAATALVEQYRAKLEELQVSNAMNADAFSSVRILSEATPPVLPSFPLPGLMLGLGLAFGVLAGIAYAVIAEILSRTFRDPAQVTRVLGLPVFATIPDMGRATGP